VLGELLHSLSQPLTGLVCSLELSLQLPLDLSIEQVAEHQQANVSVALQQTEKVIGMIQLMREYLDAEQPAPEAFSSALAPATRSVIEELSSIATVRGVRLRLVGTCAATLPVPESRLRLALQYLITTLIEPQPVGGKVMLLLGEGPAGAVLRAEGGYGFQQQKPSVTSAQTMLRRARIAIAGRVLESAGASLVFGGVDVDPTGFVLRIPRRVAAQ
jgi:hypothetical protein